MAKKKKISRIPRVDRSVAPNIVTTSTVAENAWLARDAMSDRVTCPSCNTFRDILEYNLIALDYDDRTTYEIACPACGTVCTTRHVRKNYVPISKAVVVDEPSARKSRAKKRDPGTTAATKKRISAY